MSPQKRKEKMKYLGIYKVMDGYGIGCSNNSSDASELETLQRLHQEKVMRIHELKKQIELVKLRLEEKKKKKKEIPDDRKQAFKTLSEKYNSLREEYKALLGERSRGK